MPKIYDNIEHHLTKGLHETLELSQRTDFCVGYFNLRGWKEVADNIDKLSGMTVAEGDDDILRTCRLLVGMQKMPIDILRDHFYQDKNDIIDQAEAVKLKKRLAQEFKEQLTIGTPTEADERALRKLSGQMKDNKVTVKLHLRYPLHAKLYLAYRRYFPRSGERMRAVAIRILSFRTRLFPAPGGKRAGHIPLLEGHKANGKRKIRHTGHSGGGRGGRVVSPRGNANGRGLGHCVLHDCRILRMAVRKERRQRRAGR